MNKVILIIGLCLASLISHGQADRWQQGIKYRMNIDFDTKKHQYKGEQMVSYYNNSPDTLSQVFYHLYFNAFQPGSMMDTRSTSISDPDGRVRDRISRLDREEYGYQKINSLTQNGVALEYEVEGTILEVSLAEPILPGTFVNFIMDFEAQVPMQIRRSGRNNKEGIDYSMAQWYPKMCEYDYQGWHANPYVGREFYGVWGDFDVNITIDKDYIIGATGVLQNAEEIGYGYQADLSKKVKRKGKTNTWKFKAEKVHDFVWAADPDYVVKRKKAKCGVMMYCIYQPDEELDKTWSKLPDAMDLAFDYANEHYGKYPYPVYSFIQGGDGGMEYPMATLITGKRNFGSLVGVSVHELMHSWYQMILGFNESLYPWMDEGFTSYTSTFIMNDLRSKGVFGEPEFRSNPFERTYRGYAAYAVSSSHEALVTHADHYTTNSAYGAGSYTKGSVFLRQLEYVIGKEVLDAGMLRFYNTWKFKHPNINDFIRVMEKESGLELDWYKEYWVNTTHNIDYAVDTISYNNNTATVQLSKIGVMPMPIDVQVSFEDGSTKAYSIPLRIMRGHKPLNNMELAKDWPWTHSSYTLEVNTKGKKIAKVEIDPSKKLCDIVTDNNVIPRAEKKEKEK